MDMTDHEMSVILETLRFPTLLEPFKKNCVSGRMVSRISSYQDIIDFDKEKVSKVVAQTFFEDFVMKWQSTGRVPTTTIYPTPVCMYVCRYVRMGRSWHIHKSSTIRSGRHLM